MRLPVFLLTFLVALALPCATTAQNAAAALDALVAAYPQALARHDGRVITFRDGTTLPAHDGVEKSHAQRLRRASILDQFHDAYPRGPLAAPPATDPGRYRNTAFFSAMYGDCRKGGVRQHLVEVRWLPLTWGKPLYVTRVNGVADALRAVSAEIDALPADISRAAFPAAGVYACRTVADTGQPSMHAYAAAIDLSTAHADYWLWRGSKNGMRPYRNRMPPEIVAIFERHGFIWGGKWRHYDTMHFEYRPELLGMRGR
jgi:hypothetical protein